MLILPSDKGVKRFVNPKPYRSDLPGQSGGKCPPLRTKDSVGYNSSQRSRNKDSGEMFLIINSSERSSRGPSFAL